MKHLFSILFFSLIALASSAQARYTLVEWPGDLPAGQQPQFIGILDSPVDLVEFTNNDGVSTTVQFGSVVYAVRQVTYVAADLIQIVNGPYMGEVDQIVLHVAFEANAPPE